MGKAIKSEKRADRIDLKNVYDWKVKRDRKKVRYKLKTQRLDWEIILEAKTGTIYSEWKIMGPDYDKEKNDVFHTWLYWVMVSLIEHSECKITEKQEKMLLKDRRRKKIRGRRDKRKFDVRHEMFIGLIDDMSNIGPKLPERKKTAFKGEGGKKFKEVEFTLAKIIGSSKSSIYEAKWEKTKKEEWPVAVKIINYDEDRKVKNVINEARILAAAGPHPNIIRLIDAKAFQDYLTIYMEKANTTLDGAADTLTKYERLGVAGGILNGVSHLHSRGIYHLDLKPDNIMIFNTETGNKLAKIIDFDISRHKAAYRNRKNLYEHPNWSRCGTLGYVPPESFEIFYNPSKSEHLEKRDAYAIAVAFMYSLIGPRCSKLDNMEPLYELSQHNTNGTMKYLERVERQLRQDKAKLKLEGLYGLAEIAMKMINHDMDKRITVKEAQEEFQNMMKTKALIKPWSPKRKYIELDKI